MDKECVRIARIGAGLILSLAVFTYVLKQWRANEIKRL